MVYIWRIKGQEVIKMDLGVKLRVQVRILHELTLNFELVVHIVIYN